MGTSPASLTTESLRGVVSPPLLDDIQPKPGSFIKAPVVLRSKPDDVQRQQRSKQEPLSVQVW